MITIKYDAGLDISIPLKSTILFGHLNVPKNATKIVIFAHGSGSSRFSKRNKFVSDSLNHFGMATLLFDLLTEDEEKIDTVTSEFRFDIPLLSERLISVTDWVLTQTALKTLKIGYFGASTGAAAALIAAANRPDAIHAVVSRGGRADLAGNALTLVQAPTLLIVGGLDDVVIKLNHDAENKMLKAKIKELTIVEGATHLFEEPGKLENVTKLARNWFLNYLK